MAVTVLSRRRFPGISVLAVRRDARRVLRALMETGAELTIALVDDAEMRTLNRAHRRKDTPTDVLAFAMREGKRVSGDDQQLGDVVISIDTATRQAAERGHAVCVEVRTLLIHGILHLLGYDHERSAAQARRMKTMERRLRTMLDTADRR